MIPDCATPLLAKTAVNPWKAGLFAAWRSNYLDVFVTICCPCIALAQIAGRIRACGGYYTTLAATGLLIEAVLVSHALSPMIPAFPAVGQSSVGMLVLVIATLRTAVRRSEFIHGSELDDCLLSLLCPCCVVVQMNVQVRPPRRDVLPAYVLWCLPLDCIARTLCTGLSRREDVAIAIEDQARLDGASRIPRRPWRAGAFESLASKHPTGAMSCCCPCVVLARVASHLRIYGGYWRVLGATSGLLVLEAVAWAAVAATETTATRPVMGWAIARSLTIMTSVALVLLVARVRQAVRARWQLQGGDVEDFFCALLCPCCTVAQLATQLDADASDSPNVLRRYTAA
ncbi:hypothetical protein ACHHYP_12794 [Achlya hypogyna]|uniref:Transmembrane protein n=1 Tax=Achlya hypogyna TaxID=1202772 RepID=A0A1V9YGJ1_ACHHY|nr:hypothetical protein ACHHYP_12794 [Achlya hypogyna]